MVKRDIVNSVNFFNGLPCRCCLVNREYSWKKTQIEKKDIYHKLEKKSNFHLHCNGSFCLYILFYEQKREETSVQEETSRNTFEHQYQSSKIGWSCYKQTPLYLVLFVFTIVCCPRTKQFPRKAKVKIWLTRFT